MRAAVNSGLTSTAQTSAALAPTRALLFFIIIANNFFQVFKAAGDFIGFFNTAVSDENLYNLLRKFIAEQKKVELDEIIKEENLNANATEEFINKAFADGELKTAGTAVIKLLPPKNMFSPGFEHALQKAFVIDKLKAFFERFSNL